MKNSAWLHCLWPEGGGAAQHRNLKVTLLFREVWESKNAEVEIENGMNVFKMTLIT